MTAQRSHLAHSPMGVVPIVWNNVDLPDLAEPYEASFVLDEIARLGFAGCQHGVNFPDGPELITELEHRDLRLAEVYAAISCDVEGPAPGAYEEVMARLDLLVRSEGEMLVVALDISPQRSEFASRSADPACPMLSENGWSQLSDLLSRIAANVTEAGKRCSFHPHVGTFIESAAETARLVDLIGPTTMGLCLDVGHFLLGGGDPATAIRAYAPLIHHVHLKDVDPEVSNALARGDLTGFEGALQQRVFTELGAGRLDLPEVLAALEEIGYRGWLMIEQDTSWLGPSEASAIALHIAKFAIRHQG